MRLFNWICVVVFSITLSLNTAVAQSKIVYKFAVFFNDKDTSLFHINQPEAFLSQHAITRKNRQKVAFTSLDFPVNVNYLNAIKHAGYQVHNSSKWFNCAIVFSDNKNALDSLQKIKGVKNVAYVGFGEIDLNNKREVDLDERIALLEQKFDKKIIKSKLDSNIYGQGLKQAEMIEANTLHKLGFAGDGVTIAVIDAGFLKANVHPVLKHAMNNVIATYDFVDMEQNVFNDDDHGTAVWSCMAALDSFNFIGTAPQAKYVLLRSEEADIEFPVEEFYWAIAAEYADSIGADIISSSLGYNAFDERIFNYKTTDLDGKTAWITRAANIAADKGLLIISSAGNEGNTLWRQVTFPSDAPQVIAVGAVDDKLRHAGFSSIGSNKNKSIKPTLMAQGEDATVASDIGTVYQGDGTSYACPILAGGIACLWPFLINDDSKQIQKILKLSANYYYHPNRYFGYGVPNLFLAYQFAQKYDTDTLLNVSVLDDKNIHVALVLTQKQKIKFTLLSASNKIVYSYTENFKFGGINRLELPRSKKVKRGVYTLVVTSNNATIGTSIIKK